MHRLGTIGLQRLDDLLARQQRLRLFAQLVDFLDLLVELHNFVLEQLVAAALIVDARGDPHMTQADHGNSEHGEPDGERYELALTRLTLLLAMRK